MKTYAIIGLLTCASLSQAQSPQERIERLNAQTLQLITQRLDAHQAVINRLAAERTTRPSYTPPTYTPPPAPVTDKYAFPTTYTPPSGARPIASIDGIDVYTRAEVGIVAAAIAIDNYCRVQEGRPLHQPQVTVYDPPAGYTPPHPNVRVVYTTPAYDKYAIPTTYAPRPVTSDGLTVSLGSQRTEAPKGPPPVEDDGLDRTLGRRK